MQPFWEGGAGREGVVLDEWVASCLLQLYFECALPGMSRCYCRVCGPVASQTWASATAGFGPVLLVVTPRTLPALLGGPGAGLTDRQTGCCVHGACAASGCCDQSCIALLWCRLYFVCLYV